MTTCAITVFSNHVLCCDVSTCSLCKSMLCNVRRYNRAGTDPTNGAYKPWITFRKMFDRS